MKFRSTNKGYTLIELMVVVTIIGLLAAFTRSAYIGYTASADRRKTQANLYELVQDMERTYTTARDYGAGSSGTLKDRYEFDIATNNLATPKTYSIIAKPKAGDARDIYTLRIDHLGNESHSDDGGITWIPGWNIQ